MAAPDLAFEKHLDDKARSQLLKEVSLMLAYALQEGLELDATTTQLVGGKNDTPITMLALPELVSLHVSLAKIVAPATPGSLAATEPVPGIFSFLRRPP